MKSKRFFTAGLALASMTLAFVPEAGAGAEPSGIGHDASPHASPHFSLHDSLGGRTVLARVVDDLTRRLVDDPRTAAMFKEVDLAKFRERLTDQLCQVSGGPCVYKGKDMHTVHDGVDITKAHFNAVVEMLQQAMETQGIAFRDQNRLLALLAPMHRAIVNASPGTGQTAAK